MEKKFNINGREKEIYYLTYQEKIDLIRDENTTEEDRTLLIENLLNSVEYDLCPKGGETKDDVFARFFSDYVNGSHDKFKAAEHMAREHRYLQSSMFKVCLEYIKLLAQNIESGRYDARNEWACNAAKYMIDGLKEKDYPY